ncbi:MAG: ABC-2 family transporter protein [Candidatus Magasanikbacteria bacterium]|nr:ABC-2 family transporter protein [Candidatus Magasanikbacteria bacterium]
MKYLRVWKQLTNCAFSTYASNRIESATFLAAKLMRFGFLGLMIISLFRFTATFAGYTRYEALLFFLTFNLVDVLSQALFRGIYLFARDVNRGNFDFALTKPVSPLFLSLLRLTDILDIIFLIPIIGLLLYVITQLAIPITVAMMLRFIFFLAVGFIISVSIHILSAVMTLWTLESDNVIWFYRRATVVGAFPPEILAPGWQLFFTFVLPIILMMSFPAKALLGILTPPQTFTALAVAAFFFGGSLLLWRASLKHYSSASS